MASMTVVNLFALVLRQTSTQVGEDINGNDCQPQGWEDVARCEIYERSKEDECDPEEVNHRASPC